MKLTGILSTSVTGLAEKNLPHGITVAPGVVASNHQHLFCMRIDPAVDDPNGGKNLVVSEVNAEPIPWGPANPHGEQAGSKRLEVDFADCESHLDSCFASHMKAQRQGDCDVMQQGGPVSMEDNSPQRHSVQ